MDPKVGLSPKQATPRSCIIAHELMSMCRFDSMPDLDYWVNSITWQLWKLDGELNGSGMEPVSSKPDFSANLDMT